MDLFKSRLLARRWVYQTIEVREYPPERRVVMGKVEDLPKILTIIKIL